MGLRRKKHRLRELGALPWWVSLVAAVVVYVAIRWVLPASSNRIVHGLGEALRDKAWWFSAPFVLAAGAAAFNSHYRKRLLDTQAGPETLRALSWQDFERLVGEAYRRQGYVVEEVGGATPDGGIDLLLHRRGSKVVVQCKRWRSVKVGVAQIREFYGAMVADKAERGIFVSSGTFTPDAIDFARGKPLELVDGTRLATLVSGLQADKH
jgi:restriction system protein